MLRCPFCLTEQTIESCEPVKETILEILDALCIPNKIVSYSNAVICLVCNEKLHSLFQFKSNCVLTEDFLYPYYSTDTEKKISLCEILLKENTCENQDLQICRLCLNTITNSSSPDIISNSETRSIFDKHLPELNLDIVKDCYVCQTCIKDLHQFSQFIKCLAKSEETLRLEKEEAIKTEARFMQVVEQEYNFREVSIVFKLEDDITIEENHLLDYEEEMTNITSSLASDKNSDVDSDTLTDVKNNTWENIQQHTHKQLDETSDFISSEPSNFDFTTDSKPYYNDKNLLKCTKCSFKTKYPTRMDHHVISHAPVSEIVHYFCNICSFKTKHCASMERHKLGFHKKPSQYSIVKCKKYKFTITDKNLDKNKLNKQFKAVPRRSIRNMNKFKKVKRNCKQCSFTGKTNHQVRKQEKGRYYCNKCSFVSNCQRTLIYHQRGHNLSEKLLFKCKKCNYTARYSKHLERHQVVHTNPKSKRLKTKLVRSTAHSRTRKNVSKKRLYTCDVCKFTTKYSHSFDRHALRHKNISEIRHYSCDVCTFTTKYSHSFDRHALQHKNISEIRHYSCDMCTFTTKYHTSFNRHVLRHKNVSKIRHYSCNVCTFTTKHRPSFDKHVLRHKDPSEIKMFKCYVCDFKTQWRQNLIRHLWTIHNIDAGLKKVEDVPNSTKCKPLPKFKGRGKEHSVFKCTRCEYETKFERCFRKHVEKHLERE